MLYSLGLKLYFKKTYTYFLLSILSSTVVELEEVLHLFFFSRLIGITDCCKEKLITVWYNDFFYFARRVKDDQQIAML